MSSQAYISSVNDETCVTITLRAKDVDELSKKAHAAGFRSFAVSVHGRFHTPDHADRASKLRRLISDSEDLRIPTLEKLFAPMRSAVDGKIIRNGSLVQHILDATLLKTVDWDLTIRSAVGQLPEYSTKTAVFAGFGNHISQALIQASSLEVVMLSKLRAAKASNLTDEPQPQLDYPAHSIAVVGMAGRFPGADSVEELWDLLIQGQSTVEPAPAERLRLSQTREYANTNWWGNFIRDPDAFDHRFFKKSSREAIAWDPQQRYFIYMLVLFCIIFSTSSQRSWDGILLPRKIL
jgi:acyl transferase domain-containing protein